MLKWFSALPDFFNGKCGLQNEAPSKVQQPGLRVDPGNITYEMLIGTGRWVSTDHNIPPATLPHVRAIAMTAWMKIDRGPDFRTRYIKIIPSPSEPYAHFIGRLKDAIKKQVKEEQIQEFLLNSWLLIMPMKIAKE